MWNKLNVFCNDTLCNDEEKITVNNYFEITYRFNQRISEIDLPEFPEVFDLIKGPKRYTACEVTNGVFIKETSFKCILIPKLPGIFVIDPACVISDLIPYYSEPITVKVLPNVQL